MQSQNATKQRKIFVLVLAVMMSLLVLFPSTTAWADDVYYSTWSEYKEAGNPASVWNDVADAMDAVFDKAIEYFEAGDLTSAYNCVNDGYYGYYETTGFERIAMGYISGSRKTEVELQFSACKAVAKQGGTLEEFTTEIETLKSMIRTDANILDGTTDDSSDDEDSSSSSSSSSTTKSAAAATFTACFSIMLREGFEAILIVGAIIAYVNKMEDGDEKKRKAKVRPIYFGSVLGIVCSFALAALLNAIKLANTASQEVIEGVTALIAVVVLYYVGNWMLSKSETDAWNAYIKDKVQKSSEKGSVLALAATAFLAVFREGAEVVLFFQPTLASGNIQAVWAGFAVGCVALVIVYLVIHFLSVKVPIKPFFTATSIIMLLMSISFLGAGIKELIEGDVFIMISPDWLSWIPTNDVLDVLGIYPTLQTLLPQIVLLVVTIVIFVVTTKKNRKIHAEAEAKRAEERAIREAEEQKAAEAAFEAKVRDIVLKVLAEQQALPTEAAE